MQIAVRLRQCDSEQLVSFARRAFVGRGRGLSGYLPANRVSCGRALGQPPRGVHQAHEDRCEGVQAHVQHALMTLRWSRIIHHAPAHVQLYRLL